MASSARAHRLASIPACSPTATTIRPSAHSVVTFVLIGLNVAAWVLVQGMGAEPYLSKSVCELGLIPGEFLGRLPPGYSVPMSESTACVMDADQEWSHR